MYIEREPEREGGRVDGRKGGGEREMREKDRDMTE